MTAFPCLACSAVGAPDAFYCPTCLAQGRTMRGARPGVLGTVGATQPAVLEVTAGTLAASAAVAAATIPGLDRDVVHVDCPSCAERSPAFADVDRAACLHCFAVLDLTPATPTTADARSCPTAGDASRARVPTPSRSA